MREGDRSGVNKPRRNEPQTEAHEQANPGHHSRAQSRNRAEQNTTCPSTRTQGVFRLSSPRCEQSIVASSLCAVHRQRHSTRQEFRQI